MPWDVGEESPKEHRAIRQRQRWQIATDGHLSTPEVAGHMRKHEAGNDERGGDAVAVVVLTSVEPRALTQHPGMCGKRFRGPLRVEAGEPSQQSTSVGGCSVCPKPHEPHGWSRAQ
jgi:hypothetical protein